MRFTQYTGQLNPWAPAALVPALARAATAAEMILGVALLFGLFTCIEAARRVGALPNQCMKLAYGLSKHQIVYELAESPQLKLRTELI